MVQEQVFRIYNAAVTSQTKAIELSQEQQHWLYKVLRKKQHDTIGVLNGQGGLAQGTLNEKQCQIGQFVHQEQQLCTIEACIAMLSLDKAKLIVEKLTEIGVTSIRFVLSQRSAKTLDDTKHLQKLKLKAIEAIRQCGNPYLPKIELINNLSECLAAYKTGNWHKVFFDESENKVSFHLNNLNRNSKVVLSVGPEASWHENERRLFFDHGFSAMSLGPNVLRVETAAIVGVARTLGCLFLNHSAEN